MVSEPSKNNLVMIKTIFNFFKYINFVLAAWSNIHVSMSSKNKGAGNEIGVPDQKHQRKRNIYFKFS